MTSAYFKPFVSPPSPPVIKCQTFADHHTPHCQHLLEFMTTPAEQGADFIRITMMNTRKITSWGEPNLRFPLSFPLDYLVKYYTLVWSLKFKVQSLVAWIFKL